MPNRLSIFGPVLLLILAMCSIQGGAALAKGLFPLVGAAGTAAIRVLFAAIILLALIRPWRKPLPRAAVSPLLLYGLSLGAMNVMFYLAIERIPLGIAVALEFTGPLALAISSSRGRLDLLWAALAGGGIFLLMPLLKSSPALDPVGVLFALGAAVMWALYIIFGQKLSGQLPATSAVALGMACAVISSLPFALVMAGDALFTVAALPLGLVVALLSSALPYLLEMMALKRLPVPVFSTLMSMEPAIGALSGLLFLHEYLTLTQWLAIGCIILASLGSSLVDRKAVPVPDVTT